MNERKYFNLLTVRMVREKAPEPYNSHITRPSDAVPMIRALIADRDREVFGVLHLNRKNKIVGFDLSHVGTEGTSLVSPSCVFRAVLLTGATGLIFFHNHPSGEVSPSDQDIHLTQRLAEAGALLGIQTHDHLIVSCSDFFSMAEAGVLPRF